MIYNAYLLIFYALLKLKNVQKFIINITFWHKKEGGGFDNFERV